MKLLFVIPILFSLLIPYQSPKQNTEAAPLTVTSFKWSRVHRNIDVPADDSTAPAQAMIPQNKNFARNARINDPAGVRDPNADTLDGRRAAMEKNVQDSRATKPKAMDGFAYRIKVQNSGPEGGRDRFLGISVPGSRGSFADFEAAVSVRREYRCE